MYLYTIVVYIVIVFHRGRLDVSAQVERLIQEATSLQNLSQCFVGWCPFW